MREESQTHSARGESTSLAEWGDFPIYFVTSSIPSVGKTHSVVASNSTHLSRSLKMITHEQSAILSVSFTALSFEDRINLLILWWSFCLFRVLFCFIVRFTAYSSFKSNLYSYVVHVNQELDPFFIKKENNNKIAWFIPAVLPWTKVDITAHINIVIVNTEFCASPDQDGTESENPHREEERCAVMGLRTWVRHPRMSGFPGRDQTTSKVVTYIVFSIKLTSLCYI